MVDTYQFQNQDDRTHAVELAKSLCCPQCQNQNLVESNSQLPYDLRLGKCTKWWMRAKQSANYR